MQQIFQFVGDLLNSGLHGEVRTIQNINNDNDKLIVKLYENPQDPNYINENRILTTLTHAANNENILRLLPANNIQLDLLQGGYPVGTQYLLFEYYPHENLSKYIYAKLDSPDENGIKYLIYKIIRAVSTIHQNNIVHGKLK